MNNNRPVNLALTTMKFPPMAIASILHRISGVVLFLLMPFVLYFLNNSLISSNNFIKVKQALTQMHWKLMLWAFLAAIIYHFLAGMRHMIMDLGYGETLKAGRLGAWIVILLAVILSIILGIWIW